MRREVWREVGRVALARGRLSDWLRRWLRRCWRWRLWERREQIAYLIRSATYLLLVVIRHHARRRRSALEDGPRLVRLDGAVWSRRGSCVEVVGKLGHKLLPAVLVQREPGASFLDEPAMR